MFAVRRQESLEFIKVRSKFAALLVAISLFHLPNLSIASRDSLKKSLLPPKNVNKVSTTWVCRLTCLLAKNFPTLG